MSEQAFHVITIKVPVPPNSTAGALGVMNGYLAEYEALKAKLPEGSEVADHIGKTRPESANGAKRKTMQERIDEAVAEDRKTRGGGSQARQQPHAA